MNIRKLVEAARRARANAYAPYSRYPVGAAVLAKSGKIYSGCNIENAAYPSGLCAERVAIFKAVSEGERELKAIAVVTRNGGSPCGACRQVFAEFAKSNAVYAIACTRGKPKLFTLVELLPERFGPEKLKQK
ncbi:MAG: cytidine deaminase [Chloroflexi bacterium]|nr:cytidine deaminase [Chloroflexota bacterium]